MRALPCSFRWMFCRTSTFGTRRVCRWRGRRDMLGGDCGAPGWAQGVGQEDGLRQRQTTSAADERKRADIRRIMGYVATLHGFAMWPRPPARTTTTASGSGFPASPRSRQELPLKSVQGLVRLRASGPATRGTVGASGSPRRQAPADWMERRSTAPAQALGQRHQWFALLAALHQPALREEGRALSELAGPPTPSPRQVSPMRWLSSASMRSWVYFSIWPTLGMSVLPSELELRHRPPHEVVE